MSFSLPGAYGVATPRESELLELQKLAGLLNQRERKKLVDHLLVENTVYIRVRKKKGADAEFLNEAEYGRLSEDVKKEVQVVIPRMLPAFFSLVFATEGAYFMGDVPEYRLTPRELAKHRMREIFHSFIVADVRPDWRKKIDLAMGARRAEFYARSTGGQSFAPQMVSEQERLRLTTPERAGPRKVLVGKQE